MGQMGQMRKGAGSAGSLLLPRFSAIRSGAPGQDRSGQDLWERWALRDVRPQRLRRGQGLHRRGFPGPVQWRARAPPRGRCPARQHPGRALPPRRGCSRLQHPYPALPYRGRGGLLSSSRERLQAQHERQASHTGRQKRAPRAGPCLRQPRIPGLLVHGRRRCHGSPPKPLHLLLCDRFVCVCPHARAGKYRILCFHVGPFS